jgi:hypothetical protein
MKSLLSLMPATLWVIFALFTGTLSALAQNTFPSSGSAGIGTASPNASSILDVVSTTKGVLVPRMTKTERDAIVSPATGLLIYQTNNTPGFYYYSGSVWTAISTKDANKTLSNLTSPTAINVGLLPGSTGTLDLGSSSLKWRDVYISNIKFADGTTQSTAGGGGGGIGGSGTTSYIPKFTATSTLGNSTLYDNGGNIGFNTTTMIGSANVTMKSLNTTGYGGMYLDMGGTSGRKPFYGYAVGGVAKVWTYYDEASNQFRIYNGGDRFVIDNSGNTGIGTTSPTTKLEVQTTGLAAVMKVTKPWTGSGSTNFNLAEFNNVYNFGYGTGVYASGGQIGAKGYAANGSQPGYGLYGEAFGAGGAAYGVYGTASATAAAAYGIYGTTTGGTSQWAGYFDGKVQFVNGSDASLSSDGYIELGSTSSTNVIIDNNEIMARNNGATSKLYLQNDGGDVSMCYSGGGVMIGSSYVPTGYLFAVDGNIICEELKVQLSENWPDYVFADDYSMHSISELKEFIEENNHLPGIPTATEVEKEGISVGQMQTRMMEKIEELSLYIIQLQNQIDELKAQKN